MNRPSINQPMPRPDPLPAPPRPAAPRRTQPLVRDPGVEYWRVHRVARYLDISKKRVYQLVQEKRLTAIRLGPRQMRILRASIDDYVQALMEAGVYERDEEDG